MRLRRERECENLLEPLTRLLQLFPFLREAPLGPGHRRKPNRGNGKNGHRQASQLLLVCSDRCWALGIKGLAGPAGGTDVPELV